MSSDTLHRPAVQAHTLGSHCISLLSAPATAFRSRNHSVPAGGRRWGPRGTCPAHPERFKLLAGTLLRALKAPGAVCPCGPEPAPSRTPEAGDQGKFGKVLTSAGSPALPPPVQAGRSASGPRFRGGGSRPPQEGPQEAGKPGWAPPGCRLPEPRGRPVQGHSVPSTSPGAPHLPAGVSAQPPALRPASHPQRRAL